MADKAHHFTDSSARHDSTTGREAARGAGVDKQAPMSGYTHLKKDDNGPPEAAWFDFNKAEQEASKQQQQQTGEKVDSTKDMKE